MAKISALPMAVKILVPVLVVLMAMSCCCCGGFLLLSSSGNRSGEVDWGDGSFESDFDVDWDDSSSGSSDGTGVTEEGYQAIQTGMTEAQVESILGTAGTELSAAGPVKSVIYEGDGFNTISITYIDGVVQAKGKTF